MTPSCGRYNLGVLKPFLSSICLTQRATRQLLDGAHAMGPVLITAIRGQHPALRSYHYRSFGSLLSNSYHVISKSLITVTTTSKLFEQVAGCFSCVYACTFRILLSGFKPDLDDKVWHVICSRSNAISMASSTPVLHGCMLRGSL